MVSVEKRKKLQGIKENIQRYLKGKEEVVDMAIMGILARGNILIEDVPGVGKTSLAFLLARSLDCSFQRIQFTSDLLPTDILGVTVYNQQEERFVFKPGPIFANIVLADEINRTTPKTQSALLEAMNIGEVTIDKVTHGLPRPFLVIATQNPIEFHGTFPLPTSQMDRFLLRLRMGYPDAEQEMVMMKEKSEIGMPDKVPVMMTGRDVLEMQEEVKQVKLDDDLLAYIANIAQATRNSEMIELGVSPRGSLSLKIAIQARAYYLGRDYCIPDDVKKMALPVLGHRIVFARTFEAPALGFQEEERMLQRILEQVEVPL